MFGQIQFASILFLALSCVPETADQMTVTVNGVGVSFMLGPLEYTYLRSGDEWRVFVEGENPEEIRINRRGDFVLFSRVKDASRVAAYLDSLGETGCDTCGKWEPKSPLDPLKPCDVHLEIPGFVFDMAWLMEKPEDGWPCVGELRDRRPRRADVDARTEIKTAEDGSGLDIGFTRAAPDGTRQEYGATYKVRWSKVEE